MVQIKKTEGIGGYDVKQLSTKANSKLEFTRDVGNIVDESGTNIVFNLNPKKRKFINKHPLQKS